MFLLAFSCDNISIYFNNVFVSFFLLFEWYEYSFCDTLGKIQLFFICIKIDLLNTIVGQSKNPNIKMTLNKIGSIFTYTLSSSARPTHH